VHGSVGVVQHLEYLPESTATSRFRHGDPLLPIINGRFAWTSRFSLQIGLNSSLVPASKVISASSVLDRSSINANQVSIAQFDHSMTVSQQCSPR